MLFIQFILGVLVLDYHALFSQTGVYNINGGDRLVDARDYGRTSD